MLLLDSALNAIADAAASLAPALSAGEVMAVGPTTTGAAASDLGALGPGSVAVTAGFVGDLSGRLVLGLSAPLAETHQQDPGGEDLPSILQPALAMTVDALARALGVTLATGEPEVMAAADVMPRPGDDVISVSLLDAGMPGATLAVFLPQATLEAGPPAVGEAGAVPGGAGAMTHGDMGFPSFDGDATVPGSGRGGRRPGPQGPFDMLHDVELEITAELGRTRMTVRELLALVPGSIVELDRAAGSQLDLYVNGTLMARGEVVVIDDEFGVRITEVIGRDGIGER